MILELNNLSKSFKERELFHIDNIKFSNDNIYCIVGENGCGKSTLLRIISGLDMEYKGDILIEKEGKVGDSILNNLSEVVYIHQKPYIFNFTVYENINMARKIESSKPPIVESKYLIERFNIENILKSNGKSISGGEGQKVSFIRGLNQSGSIILLDEPTSNMDGKSSLEVEKILSEIKKDRIIIIVTHNILQALRLGDYILSFENNTFKLLNIDEAKKEKNIKELIKFVGNIGIEI